MKLEKIKSIAVWRMQYNIKVPRIYAVYIAECDKLAAGLPYDSFRYVIATRTDTTAVLSLVSEQWKLENIS